jgi:hypothetical protein
LKTYSNYFGEAQLFNRKWLAVPSVLLAAFVVCSSVGGPAYAGDVSGSEAASVETTKEASTAAPVEETKKAEEVPVAPVKEESVAPAAPVVPVVPAPVAAPAPPMEQPAPAPAAPQPAAPAAPVAPQVETPVAPEQPAAPAKDVVIDDPAPVVVVPPAEAVTPPGDPAPVEDTTPVIKVNVMITTVQEINAQGWIFLTAETQNVAPGATIGTYTVNLTDAKSQLGVNTATLVAGEDGTASRTLWWECAVPGATISVTGPNGLLPIFNDITGTTATVQTLPILGTPGCGTTTPTKTVLPVTPGAPKFIPAGPGKHGSIEYPGTLGVVYTADPAGATEGPVKVTATAAPETADTIYVIAPGAQTEWSGDLGEFSESVPNPGGYPAYGDAKVAPSGAAAITPAGPFNTTEYVFASVSGKTKNGSPVTVASAPQATQGGSDPITAQLNLTGMCGLAHWSWYASDNESGSPKWTIGAGIVQLPACDSTTKVDPAYPSGTFEESGHGVLTPEGEFNRTDTVVLQVSGPSRVDGSTKTVEKTFEMVDGKSPVVADIDLSVFCGTVQWAWLSEAKDNLASSRTLLFEGELNLPACDPQGGDDGGDNENPNPNPNPDPSHPGHGHGHGDDDGDHGGCFSWNHHSCEPGNNGPVGTPGDLNNGGVEADASANNVVVQSSTVEELGMGNALPEESDLSNANSSVEDPLAYTGSDDPLHWTVIGLGLFVMGLVLVAWMRPRKRK